MNNISVNNVYVKYIFIYPCSSPKLCLFHNSMIFLWVTGPKFNDFSMIFSFSQISRTFHEIQWFFHDLETDLNFNDFSRAVGTLVLQNLVIIGSTGRVDGNADILTWSHSGCVLHQGILTTPVPFVPWQSSLPIPRYNLTLKIQGQRYPSRRSIQLTHFRSVSHQGILSTPVPLIPWQLGLPFPRYNLTLKIQG